MKIKIDGSGPTCENYRVCLDDVDYSRNITNVTINLGIKVPNTATISFTRVEFDAELEALLRQAEQEIEQDVEQEH